MPLDSQAVSFDDARSDLEDRMDEVADRQLDASGPTAKRLLELGQDINAQINVLRKLENGNVDVYDAEGNHVRTWEFGSARLLGLTAGDINLVEDVVEDDDRVRPRDAWVAIGSEDVPYIAHDRSDWSRSDFEETIENVVDLPLPYIEWAEARITELSHLDEEAGNGYLELVREKQQEATQSADEPTTSGG